MIKRSKFDQMVKLYQTVRFDQMVKLIRRSDCPDDQSNQTIRFDQMMVKLDWTVKFIQIVKFDQAVSFDQMVKLDRTVGLDQRSIGFVATESCAIERDRG